MARALPKMDSPLSSESLSHSAQRSRGQESLGCGSARGLEGTQDALQSQHASSDPGLRPVTDTTWPTAISNLVPHMSSRLLDLTHSEQRGLSPEISCRAKLPECIS